MVLEAPRACDELYLARAADNGGVPLCRPVMTGDVFAGVDLPGVGPVDGDQEHLAMVVSHPCSMRDGPVLRSHVQMVRVVRRAPIELPLWAKAHYDLMPLPELTVLVEPHLTGEVLPDEERLARTAEGAHAAMFDLRGRVDTTVLDLDQRIACLTEVGVAFLHQRMGHHDTRHAPEIEQLMLACDPVFSEIELWEQWNDRLIPPEVLSDPERRGAALEAVAREFDDVLSEKRTVPGKKDARKILRVDLGIKKTQAGARRDIYRILEHRVKERAQAG